MTITLANRTALITGASSGIGRACALYLANAGAAVVLVARRRERLQTLLSEIESGGGAGFILEADVTQTAELEARFRNLPGRWQAIDILINNAGLSVGTDPQWQIPQADMERMIDTNIKGLLTMTRLCVPGMIQRSQGHVVNLGSIAGHETYPGGAVYCATKSAVAALTRGLKMDLLGTGVRVTAIDPGMVETGFSLVRSRGDEQVAAQVYAGLTPLRADDIADAVLWSVTRPAHVNISEIIILATDQSSARMVHRSRGDEQRKPNAAE